MRNYLFLMVGHAGSGKSYFARRLSTDRGYVRLNGDSMRMALWGSLDVVQIQPVEVRREGIFEAVDYAARQVLQAGHTVIYDANNNRLQVRASKAEMALQNDVVTISIWIKTGKDEALSRVQNRSEQVDQRVYDEKRGLRVIERHIDNFDQFKAGEHVIEIDGLVPFEKQLESFDQQLKAMQLDE